MRHYLISNEEITTHNCLERRQRLFQAGEIRLEMVKEKTPERMGIFIQLKAVFFSIYLGLSFFSLYSFI